MCPYVSAFQVLRYVASPGSVSYLHNEVNGMPSINIVLGEGVKEEDKGPKLWVVIHPPHLYKLSEYLGRGKNVCPSLAVHNPGKFFDLSLLDRLGITYGIIVQRPGDVVFLNRDCPHMVLNLGYNVADATMFSTPSLNTRARSLECHGCRGNTLGHQDNVIYGSGSVKEFKPIKCAVRSCRQTFMSAYEYRVHKKDHLKCPTCGRTYESYFSMRYHLATHTDSPVKCPEDGCSATISSKSLLQRHITACHCPKRPCKMCGKEVSLLSIKRHERNCKVKGKPVSLPSDSTLYLAPTTVPSKFVYSIVRNSGPDNNV